MRSLPLGVRAYLWGAGLACLALVIGECVRPGVLSAPWHDHTLLLQAAIFIVLAYAGERTALRINEFVDQTLATPIHIAVILLFPRPLPLLIALVAVTISQLVHVRLPLYKRLFNISHVVLAVGCSSLVFSLVGTPGMVLRPDHITAAIPLMAGVVVLYYSFDVAIMVGLLSLLDARTPLQVWRRAYAHTVAPEISTGAIGILAAVLWRDDPVLVALLALPMTALRTSFRAIAQAEDRAGALRRRGAGLEAVLAAGQRVRLPQPPAEIVEFVAGAARIVVGATMVAAYLPDDDDPTLLRRTVTAPSDAVGAPEMLPAPLTGRGIGAAAGGTLLVPLELEGAGLLGLLFLALGPHNQAEENRDALAILATQGAIALQNARLYQDAQDAAAAREADRLKGELLNTVSHELRTPLGAIKGFVSGLLTYGERMSEADRVDALRMIDEGADRLAELVDNLLSAQGLETGALTIRHEPVDLAALVRAVVAEASPRAPSHTLAARVAAVAPLVVGDERRLRQVLMNLIDNAVKYSPEGGNVTVTLAARQSLVELRVSDEGIGLPAEQLEHIFERFHRVDNSSTRRIYGTGLGLSIVRGLVEAHGGRVWAESAGAGQGATFVVVLPAAEGEAEREEPSRGQRDVTG